MTRGRKESHIKRLLDKTVFDTSTGCWVWAAGKTNGGYGLFKGPGGYVAHRVAYTLLTGPIPDRLHLDHLCSNRACVNPDHLEPVTQAENNRRMWAQTTHCPKGHPKTPENTMFKKCGGRECSECNRVRARANSAKRKACHGNTAKRVTDDQCFEEGGCQGR